MKKFTPNAHTHLYNTEKLQPKQGVIKKVWISAYIATIECWKIK